MSTTMIVSIVIIVVVIALIAGFIGISYFAKNAAEKRAKSEEAQPAEAAAEEAKAEQPAEEPKAEEPEEEPKAEEPVEEPEAEAEEEDEPEEEPEEEAEDEPEDEAEEPAPEAAEEIAAAAAVAGSAEPVAPAAVSAGENIAGELLIVREMSPVLREALGVVGAEHDDEVYSVRYSYSFKARLVLSNEETRGYYSELAAEIGSYKKMRRRDSRRQQNVNIGRARAAVILFKGKKLCLALALDPKEFEGTKYRGKDVSAMKRFATTPMLLKVDSARRIKYAKVLLARLAEENGLQQGKALAKDSEVPALTRDELIAANEIKVTGKKVEPEA